MESDGSGGKLGVLVHKYLHYQYNSTNPDTWGSEWGCVPSPATYKSTTVLALLVQQYKY
jgi:hypothetical protein